MVSLSRPKEVRSQETSMPARLRQARSLWLIWFILFIWFIWFIRLVWINQINETNQTNQITFFVRWRTFSASC